MQTRPAYPVMNKKLVLKRRRSVNSAASFPGQIVGYPEAIHLAEKSPLPEKWPVLVERRYRKLAVSGSLAVVQG